MDESFWTGFEKRAGLKSGLGKAWHAAKAPFKGVHHFFKNVGQAAENINVGTEAGRRAAESASGAIPKIEKILGEKSDKALKYLKRGGLTGLGIYGAGKASQIPADIERYKYYHQQRRLSKKQLKRLDKMDEADRG